MTEKFCVLEKTVTASTSDHQDGISHVVCGISYIVLCTVLAHRLTRRLVAPIEKMADNIVLLEENDVYDEMKPFVATIKQQHVDILKHSQMRQEFTANVSHELKTPLTAISGYAELIASGMTSGEDTIHFATEIHKSAERLQYLINDIIKLSELDSDDTKIEFETLDLHEMALNCRQIDGDPGGKERGDGGSTGRSHLGSGKSKSNR